MELTPVLHEILIIIRNGQPVEDSEDLAKLKKANLIKPKGERYELTPKGQKAIAESKYS